MNPNNNAEIWMAFI